MKNQKILIIGGGVIGLGIGWQLAKAGAAVTIHDSGAETMRPYLVKHPSRI